MADGNDLISSDILGDQKQYSPWPYISMGALSHIGNSVAQGAAIQASGKFSETQDAINADLAERAGKNALIKGEWEGNQLLKSGRAKASGVIAAAGRQGVTPGSVAPLASDYEDTSAMDALQAKANAYQVAFGYKVQESMDREHADITRATTDAQFRNTLLSGGLEALNGTLKGYMGYQEMASGHMSGGGR